MAGRRPGTKSHFSEKMTFKFEQQTVWQAALEYIDWIYTAAGTLPRSEAYNLKSQIIQPAASAALNSAQGATGQTDAEQARCLGLAVRSLIETAACHRLTARRCPLNGGPAAELDQALLSPSHPAAVQRQPSMVSL